ncbi:MULTISPECIES: hypothetical protein [Streptosporangium]|uniref:Integral membrane protein n=1 Tax=Streptosporangium brasiliense TaxID=47480 RepID=A0ABT9RL04_9ACTN|nr:hypothetical protein [Streptosporangium brasiliense]MDP9869979.1 hypothetical protein [Streptosporangium brasiliense]
MRATIEARRELGPEYETALVEAFVERLDASIAARVRAEMHLAGGRHPHPGPYPEPHPGHRPRQRKGGSSTAIALGSMGIGIPLTAIAAGEAGTAGLLLAWGGIVVINIAHAISRWRGRD